MPGYLFEPFEPGEAVGRQAAELLEQALQQRGPGIERETLVSAAKVYDNLVYALSINRLG